MAELADATPTEDLRPAFFDAGTRRLFGCLHLPIVRARGQAVVICNPLGPEYERSHRALRQLAARLASAGFATLRFDYAGTGDSAGSCDDVAMQAWTDDVDAAIGYAKRQARTAEAILIGVRFGAMLAAHAAARRDDCARLVLWRPIGEGRALLAEWEREHAADLAARGRGPSGPDDDSLLGWRMPEPWREALRAMAMPSLAALDRPVLVLDDASATDAPGGAGARVRRIADPSGPIWRQDPMSPLVPAATLAAILEWLETPDAR